MLRTTLSVLLLTSFLISCKEEERLARDYPLVSTKSVTEITEEGVTFNGEVGELNYNEIIDYGFVWGKEKHLSLEDNLSKSAGTPSSRNFSTHIRSSLASGETYYLRAFAKTKSTIVYGNLLSFRSKGSSEPVLDIFSISSSILKECNTLTINWKNDIIKSIDNLEINDIKYKDYLIQDGTIKVVPLLPASSLRIRIESKGYSAEKEFEMSTMVPKIISTFPSVVGLNDTIDIEFDYLPKCTARAYISGGVNFAGQTGLIIEDNKLRLIFKGSYCYIPNNFKITISTSTLLMESPIISKKPDGWLRKNDSPVRGLNGFSFSIGNKGYRGYAGYNLWEYDPLTDHWTEKGLVPDVSFNAGAFVIEGKAYVGVGGGVTDLWEYEPTTDTWRQMTSFPGEVRHQNAIFFALNGKGYVGGGQSTDESGQYIWLKDFWEFDPTINQWKRKRDLPQKSGFDPKAFGFNSLGYYVTKVGNYYESYYYDPVKNEWGGSDQPFYPSPNGTTINSVFVFAGDTFIIISKDTYKIDLPSNQLTLVSCAPTTSNYFSFVINGKGYMGLGEITEEVFEFDPSKL